MVKKMWLTTLKPSLPLKIGDKILPIFSDLQLLIEKVPKRFHSLSFGDLDISDIMNVDKALKICDMKVDEALKKIYLNESNTKISRLFLRLMRCNTCRLQILICRQSKELQCHGTQLFFAWLDSSKQIRRIFNQQHVR